MGSPGLAIIRETYMRQPRQNLSGAPASVITSQPASWQTFAGWSDISRGMIVTVIMAIMTVITGNLSRSCFWEATQDPWA